MKIWYKQDEGRELYTFYMEKLIEAPLFNVLSILAEAQTFKDWVPLMYRSDVSHEVSQFRKVGMFSLRLPWPFTNRSTYLKVTATDVPNQPCIIIGMNSISDSFLGHKIEKDPKTVEALISFCTIYIEKLDENKCIMRMICNADPQMTKVP